MGNLITPEIFVFIGTAKGLYRATSDATRREWTVAGPILTDRQVTSVHSDAKNHRVLVATRSAAASGAADDATIWMSDDLGGTWRRALRSPRFPNECGSTVKQIWEITAGARSSELFAGTEDSGLFWSNDLGNTWEELPGLRTWPTGAGGSGTWASGSLVHSIVVDPTDARCLWVASSTAGVLRSDDRGATWVEANHGTDLTIAHGALRTHKLILSSVDRRTLYLQHFEGVYRSSIGSSTWERVGRDLPTPFGFPIVETAEGDLFVAPLVSYAERFMPEGRLRLYRSRDNGLSWFPSDQGLPTCPNFGGVLRDALAVDSLRQIGVYFGTTSGDVFASPDRGETWLPLPGSYPRVSAIETMAIGN